MAIGENSLHSGLSYLALGREQTLGTRDTASAGLLFVSSSVKAMKERQVLEQIETSRTYSKSIGLGRVIEGDVEAYLGVDNTACVWLLQNAFGIISSATATGETAGAGASSMVDHTFQIGDIQNQTYTALTLNERKGDSTQGKVMEYVGCRVNELTISNELDGPLMMSASIIGKDATTGASDVSGGLGNITQDPLNFNIGRLSIESAFASLTASSFWHIQSFEFGLSNNLKSDSESRRIGSDTLDVLPPGMATFNFTATIRFDTTTAYDAMIAGTEFAAEIEFIESSTATGSNLQKRFNLTMPRILVSDAGDPEIGGPDEVLQSEVTFTVLRDDSSANGYAVQAIVSNQVDSYD